MNPEVPERERNPVPKRRWRPLDEPDKRTIAEPSLQFAQNVGGPEFDMQPAWSGH